MIINSGYGGNSKDKNNNREYLKRKAHETFYIKGKHTSHMQSGEQLKLLNQRKAQARVSTSMGEINPSATNNPNLKEEHRFASLEVSDIAGLDTLLPKPIKQKKPNIGHCWSQRNVSLVADPSKMQKYRKFSSNAQLSDSHPRPDSQRRKLSLVDDPAPPRKIDRLGVMAWLILIRKLFAEEWRRRSSKTVKLAVLYSYIQKLDGTGLQEFALIVEPLEYELELTKTQMLAVLQTYFEGLRKTRGGKTEGSRASLSEVVGCLAQFQSKNSNPARTQANSASSEEEAVETARFQEGGQDVKKRKLSQKKAQVGSGLVPKMQTNKFIRQHGKQNAAANMPTEALFKSPTAYSKTRQSLNPSHSPFTHNDSRAIENSRALLQREENDAHMPELQDGLHSQLLGMLSLQGKSPRELMVSQIYESIQREGFLHHNNNVSFSLQHLEPDIRPSFQRTVHSFEEILRKIRSIQNSYKAKLDRNGERTEEEVNLFLEQLINYRIASGKQGSEEEYSYLASFQDLSEVREHNRGIMLALLQSTYLRDYFNALEGLRVTNSLPFLKNIVHLLHPCLRVLNLASNCINTPALLANALPHDNSLEFLNLNHNFIADITSILKKCPRLKEFHSHDNLVTSVREACVTSQQLRIIDLSSNKIQQEGDLCGLVGVNSLVILNLIGNPLTQASNWKAEWSGSINLNVICLMDNLYMMSAFGYQKDITFSITKTPPKQDKDRYHSTGLIHEFTTSDLNRSTSDLNKSTEPPRFGKQTPKTETHLSSKSSSKPQDQPKQKISKIKAFIDGKVI